MNRNMGKDKREHGKLPLFYKIFFICLGVALIVSIFVLRSAKNFLNDFEASQPKHVADGIFEKYYCSGDFTALAAKCAESNPFADASAVAEYLNRNYADKEMTCTSGASKDGMPTFIVKVGEYKISSFTLREYGERSLAIFNMKIFDYEEGDFEVYYEKSKVTVYAPTGYSVEIDGVALTDEYVAEKGILSPEAEANLLPEGVEGITNVRYEVEGLLSDPQVKATTPEGRVAPVTYEEKDGAYHAYPLFDEALEAELSDYVIEGVSMYALMMSDDQWWGNVSKYFDPDSAIYEDAQDVSQYTWFTLDHDSAKITDSSASQFLRYSENVFSCRVKFTEVLTQGTKEFKDFFDSTVIWRRVDGTWKICGMINNA